MAKRQSKTTSKAAKVDPPEAPSYRDPEREARISAAFMRMQDEWLGPNPTTEMLKALEDRLPGAVETIEQNRFEWVRLASKLADQLDLGHRDFAIKQLARHLLDSTGLRDCELVVCNQWIRSDVPTELRRALSALVHHVSSVITERGNDLSPAQRGLRAAAAAIAATDPSQPTERFATHGQDGQGAAGESGEPERRALPALTRVEKAIALLIRDIHSPRSVRQYARDVGLSHSTLSRDATWRLAWDGAKLAAKKDQSELPTGSKDVDGNLEAVANNRCENCRQQPAEQTVAVNGESLRLCQECAGKHSPRTT